MAKRRGDLLIRGLYRDYSASGDSESRDKLMRELGRRGRLWATLISGYHQSVFIRVHGDVDVPRGRNRDMPFLELWGSFDMKSMGKRSSLRKALEELRQDYGARSRVLERRERLEEHHPEEIADRREWVIETRKLAREQRKRGIVGWNPPDNPWRMHPAIAGLQIPESALPPGGSWSGAVELGFVGPARNPGDPIDKGVLKWSGGPAAPAVKGGRMRVPGDTPSKIYNWLLDQAKERLRDMKKYILTNGRNPTLAALTHKYTVEPHRISKSSGRVVPGTIEKWAGGLRARAAERGIPVSRLEIPEPQRFNPRTLKIPKGVIYFASGAKSPGEIEGISRAGKGVGIGIDVSLCKDDCLLALKKAAKKKSTHLFVDSGAFRELKGRTVTDAEWSERFKGYAPLARLFGKRAYLVAPDKIGDQQETARRVAAFGHLMPPKAMILLAAQGGRGQMPRYLFWEELRKILIKSNSSVRNNRNRIVAALPLKAEGFGLEEVTAFARYFGEDVKRYHLLGMSPLKKPPRGTPKEPGLSLFMKILKVIWEESPGATITCDATTIISGVRGHSWKLGVLPEPYIYAQDIVRFDLMLEAFQKSWRGGHTMEGWISGFGWGQKDVPDYTDWIIEPDEWLPDNYRKVLADWLEDRYKRGFGVKFGKAEHEQLLKSVEDWLYTPIHPDDPQGPKWYDDWEVESWIDDQWVRLLGSYFSARVKRDALEEAWLATVDAAINDLVLSSD